MLCGVLEMRISAPLYRRVSAFVWSGMTFIVLSIAQNLWEQSDGLYGSYSWKWDVDWTISADFFLFLAALFLGMTILQFIQEPRET